MSKQDKLRHFNCNLWPFGHSDQLHYS